MVIVAVIVFAGAYAYNAYRSNNNPAYMEEVVE
jgi:hypothetical protein